MFLQILQGWYCLSFCIVILRVLQQWYDQSAYLFISVPNRDLFNASSVL